MFCFGLLVIMYCNRPAPAPAANTYCLIAEPIQWHADDTVKTKRQADRENRKYKRLCQKDAAK